jgi:hypothetical protein
MQKGIPAIVAVFVLLFGCATPQSRPVTERIKEPFVLPDQPLNGKGLLVASIGGRAVAQTRLQRATITAPGIQIDSTQYTNAVRDGYLVLPLNPGDYTLVMLSVANETDTPYTTFPLNYKFHITANRATNVGGIVLVPQRGNEKGFIRVLIDNTAEMAAHLRKTYPRMTASLLSPTPDMTTANKLASSAAIDAVRQEIARMELLWTEDMYTAAYLGGDAGTIARLLRDSQGKIAAFDVLDAGTTAAMVSCSGHDNRYVCGSVEPALYFVNDDKVTRRPVPFPMKWVKVHTFPPAGLVLVDESMNVYASPNNGGSWTKYSWFAPKEPIFSFSPIRFANGRNGYYVYTLSSLDPLAADVIYSDYSPAAYRRIEIPKMKLWQRLLETPDGLLVGPQNGASKSDFATLYFRENGRSDWKSLKLPGQYCLAPQRVDKTSNKLRVFCETRKYDSTDSGKTWVELPPKPNS